MATTNGHTNGRNGHSGARRRSPRGTQPPIIDAPHPAEARPSDRRTLPHSLDLEMSVLGAVFCRNDTLAEMSLDIDDFYDYRHKVVFGAMSKLAEKREPIDTTTLGLALDRDERLDAVGGYGYLGELVLRVPTVDNAMAYARELRILARNRKVMLKLGDSLERAYGWPHDPGELIAEIAGEMQSLIAADPSRSKMAFAPSLSEELWSRRNEPWVHLKLGDGELCRARAGGIVVMIGGSGSGKTSLAACLLIQHAQHVGPAIFVSIEMPRDELGARIVGIRCNAGWTDALRGEVRREFVDDALALPRLCVLDRGNATLENLVDAIRVVRSRFPGEPVLIAIDYVQLLDSKEWEARQRVADIMQRIDDIARRERVVVIALSQMGRSQAREARSGDRIGAETTDLGAESAALERWATVTIAIGKRTPIEGTDEEAVELSIGKCRMGEGDLVMPSVFNGFSGPWRLAGQSKSASLVRTERVEERKRERISDLDRQILDVLVHRKEPSTMSEVADLVNGRRKDVLVRIAALKSCGLVVEVARKRLGSSAWMIMHSERAREGNVTLVERTGEQRTIELPTERTHP